MWLPERTCVQAGLSSCIECPSVLHGAAIERLPLCHLAIPPKPRATHSIVPGELVWEWLYGCLTLTIHGLPRQQHWQVDRVTSYPLMFVLCGPAITVIEPNKFEIISGSFFVGYCSVYSSLSNCTWSASWCWVTQTACHLSPKGY